MNAMAFERDGTLFIRHNDGTEESFADFRTRVLKDMPQALAADMTRSTKSQGGNYNISFDNGYFPGVDRTRSREENDVARSTAIGKRFAVMGRLIEGLVKAGLQPGLDFTPKDSYPDQKNQGVWHPTTQLWVNVNGQRAASPQVTKTDDELLTQAMVHDEAAVDALIENAKAYGEDGKLTAYGRAKLKAIAIRGQQGNAPSKPATESEQDAEQDSGDDMPTD